MKAVVAAFNQEKALVGAFSVIVQPVVEPMEHYTALIIKKQGPAELLPKYYSHQSKQAGKNYKRSTSLITPMKKKIKTYKKSLKKD